MQRAPVTLVVLGVFAALLALLPIGYLLLRLADGYERALAELMRPRTLELGWNTLALTLSVAITALALGFFQAWLTTRTNLPFARAFAVLATLPLAIPSYVLALGYLSIFPSFSGFFPSWITLSVATAPYVFLAVSAAMMRLSPATEEVSRSLGYSRWQTLARITWPQVRPAATASLLLVILYTLSEFGAVSLLRFDTFTRAIYNAYRGSFDRTAAASLALGLVLLTILVILIERRYRGDYLSAPTQPARRRKIELGSARIPLALLLLVFAVISVLLPVLALAGWSVAGSSSANLGELFAALIGSVNVAVFAGVIIGIFAIAISIWNLRYHSKLSALIEGTSWAAHALPAIVVALALVFVGANLLPGIYQTIWLLLAAYVILFLPNALSAVATPLAQVPKSIEQVSRSLGMSRAKTLIRVVLPISAPGIVAGVSLAALTVLKELPATLLLRPTGYETLATELWAATENLAYAQAAPYALALIIIAGAPALLLNAQARKLVSEVN